MIFNQSTTITNLESSENLSINSLSHSTHRPESRKRSRIDDTRINNENYNDHNYLAQNSDDTHHSYSNSSSKDRRISNLDGDDDKTLLYSYPIDDISNSLDNNRYFVPILYSSSNNRDHTQSIEIDLIENDESSFSNPLNHLNHISNIEENEELIPASLMSTNSNDENSTNLVSSFNSELTSYNSSLSSTPLIDFHSNDDELFPGVLSSSQGADPLSLQRCVSAPPMFLYESQDSYFHPLHNPADDNINSHSHSVVQSTPIYPIEYQPLLPHRVITHGIRTITFDVVNDLLTGSYDDNYNKIILVDCRFNFEYDGGHIIGAIRSQGPEDIEKIFLTEEVIHSQECFSDICIVFYCEYSQQRAPQSLSYLRRRDREIHSENWPALFYPEIYLLEGGYSKFFLQYSKHCDPCNYISMFHKDYNEQCRQQHSNRKEKWKRRCRTPSSHSTHHNSHFSTHHIPHSQLISSNETSSIHLLSSLSISALSSITTPSVIRPSTAPSAPFSPLSSALSSINISMSSESSSSSSSLSSNTGVNHSNESQTNNPSSNSSQRRQAFNFKILNHINDD